MFNMRFKIKGILPLLFDNFASTLEDQIKKKKRTKANAAVGEWSEGQLYFSPESLKNGKCISIPIKHWLEQALIEGARRVKVGRKSLKDEAPNMRVVEEYYDTDKTKPDIIVKSFPKKDTGQRVYAEKPGLTKWTCEFTLCILNDEVPEAKVNELIESVGMYQGLGAWRKKYGKFVVTDAKIVE